MQRFLQILLTAWAGSLWTICAIVAPSLFALIPDRHVAGQTAGHFFRIEAWLGLACGGLILILLKRGTIAWVRNWDLVLVVIAVLGPLLSELLLRPLMDDARSSENMARFGMLHGASAILFAVACFATLILIWRLATPPARQDAR